MVLEKFSVHEKCNVVYSLFQQQQECQGQVEWFNRFDVFNYCMHVSLFADQHQGEQQSMHLHL